MARTDGERKKCAPRRGRGAHAPGLLLSHRPRNCRDQSRKRTSTRDAETRAKPGLAVARPLRRPKGLSERDGQVGQVGRVSQVGNPLSYQSRQPTRLTWPVSIPPMDLANRVALITGGKRIGAVVAEQLARGGADVALVYRSSRGEAEDAAAAVRGYGRNAGGHAGRPARPGRLRARRGPDGGRARPPRHPGQHGVGVPRRGRSTT